MFEIFDNTMISTFSFGEGPRGRGVAVWYNFFFQGLIQTTELRLRLYYLINVSLSLIKRIRSFVKKIYKRIRSLAKEEE